MLHVIRQTNNPISTPSSIGMHWINTSTGATFFSVATSTVDDWIFQSYLPAGGTINQVLGKLSSDDYDVDWINQSGGGGGSSKTITGDRDTPILLNGTPDELTMAGGDEDIYVAGDSAPVTLDETCFDGAKNDGALLTLIGKDDINTVTLESGGALILNGDWVGRNNSTITLRSDALTLTEVTRNDI